MLGCSKKFLIVIVLLSIFNINKVYSDENCKLPYKLPLNFLKENYPKVEYNIQ